MLVLTVSVIIPAINEAARIERAVASAIAAGAEETIVVDGGSHDATPEKARRAGAKLIEATAGRAQQQNLGAAVASGQILLFLHADNWLGSEAIKQIRETVSAAADQTPMWGALRQCIDAPGYRYRWLEAGNAWRVRRRGLPFGDQAIFIRKTLFESQGGFPEYQLMEDLLLAQRLRREHWPCLLPGPVHVDPRRWQTHGVLRQTWRNWRLQWQLARGANPDQLARQYRRHDAQA